MAGQYLMTSRFKLAIVRWDGNQYIRHKHTHTHTHNERERQRQRQRDYLTIEELIALRYCPD